MVGLFFWFELDIVTYMIYYIRKKRGEKNMDKKKINLFISEDMYELLRNKGFFDKRSVASIIREALDEYFNKKCD